MHPVKYGLCVALSYLNLAPRYGRMYEVDPGDPPHIHERPIWIFMRHGMWGLHVLAKLNLLDEFIDETERRWDEPKPRPQRFQRRFLLGRSKKGEDR